MWPGPTDSTDHKVIHNFHFQLSRWKNCMHIPSVEETSREAYLTYLVSPVLICKHKDLRPSIHHGVRWVRKKQRLEEY